MNRTRCVLVRRSGLSIASALAESSTLLSQGVLLSAANSQNPLYGTGYGFFSAYSEDLLVAQRSAGVQDSQTSLFRPPNVRANTD